MRPEAIAGFARQIVERAETGNPIPYLDHHSKVGILRQLGEVMEGSVDSNFHLHIGVRLDDDNPASDYLFRSIQRGKQYGMSVSGGGVGYEIVKESNGDRTVEYTDVQLSEISNTTSPSWVPSFGTVLTRSLDGDATMPVDQTPAPVVAPAETPTPDAAAPTPVVVALAAPPPEAPEVERARIGVADQAAVRAAYIAFGEQLKSLGVDLTADPTAAPIAATETPKAPENTPVENSETGEQDAEGVQITRALQTAIDRAVETATAPLIATTTAQATYIAALEALPAGQYPPKVVRGKFESDETGPDLAAMAPEERMAYALKTLYPE